MKIALPPVTLRSSEVLGGGVLRPGILGIAGGRIAGAVGHEVDLRGFALLPGAVDLGGVASAGATVAETVAAAGEAAAASGTTSLWLGVDWPERRDEAAEAEVGLLDLAGAAKEMAVHVGVRLSASSHGLETADALTRCLPHLPSPFVVFRHPSDSDRIAAEAEFGGTGPLARHLCRLASVFDTMRIRYATQADPDGDHRERFSMIGARAVLRPAARGAAASARAMGEPVVLAAADLLDGDRVGRSLAAMLIAEGLCDAVASFGEADGPLRLVRHLVASGRAPLGHAWALTSSAPAGILRLGDRGALVEGTRADIAVVDPETLEVAATIAAGTLVYARPDALERFQPLLARSGLAAE